MATVNDNQSPKIRERAEATASCAGGPWFRGGVRQLRASVGGMPRVVWVLCFGIFLNRFGMFVIPFLAIYLTRRGFTTREAGWALGSYGIGLLVASILGGHLSDRIGRRKTIAWSMFLGAGSMLWLSEVTTLPAILLVSALVGVMGELYRPASSALLADVLPSESRVIGYSIYRLALNAGWAFGPATAGFLAKYSYRWLFVGDALTSILFGMVALVALPSVWIRGEGKVRWWDALRVVRKDKSFLRVLVATLAISVVFVQLNSTFGLNVTGHGFSETSVGLLLSLNGVLVVLLELPISTSLRHRRAPTRMSWGYFLIGVAFVLNGYATQLWGFGVVIFVFTIGEILSLPVSSAYVADLAPETMRGRYMGLISLMWALGVIAAPTVGLTWWHVQPQGFWWFCGCLGFFASWVIRQRGALDRTG